MKAQTRRGAAIETGVNLVVGFGLTWCANVLIMPIWGFRPPASALWTIGGVMTIISIARQYTLRRIFEWLRIRKAPPAFLYIAEEIAAERLRQINGEGYDLAHDDAHTDGALARAGAAYAYAAVFARTSPIIVKIWPWHLDQLKPADARRMLVKSGAMIIAEIGRLDRARNREAIDLMPGIIVDAAENDRQGAQQ